MKKPQNDSSVKTLLHIKRVNELLLDCIEELSDRAKIHDDSKLEDPEKELFDKYTQALKDCTYGSSEYKQYLEELAPALKHHYEENSHHPQHYDNGIEGMNLFDIIEMLMDWKAASERHDNGDIYRSIEINQERFGYTDQFKQQLINTARYLNW